VVRKILKQYLEKKQIRGKEDMDALCKKLSMKVRSLFE
jgi:hypothetical protein